MKFLPHRDKENTMLLNVMYHRKTMDRDSDYLDIVYKDMDTGEKFVETIKSPEMEFFMVKEEHQDYTHNQNFMPLNKVEMHTARYSSIEGYIAKQAGPHWQKVLDHARETADWGALRNVHKCPYVFGSDIDIENWVKIQWVIHNHNERPKTFTKQFLDIETDTIDYTGFAKDGECPINAVTIVDQETMQVYTFLLRNEKNPLIAEFEADIENFIQELHDDFDDVYGKLDYNIYMYDDEKELIRDMFRLIHTLKRDFLMIWNMDFDYNYIEARMRRLGLDPTTLFCHKDFRVQYQRYTKDKNNFDIQNKSDFAQVSSYTVWIDQMLNYAGLRKGQGELRSFSLNAVAQNEIKEKKLDYGEDADIKTLAWRNYRRFVKYNIKDVLLQMGIENKTNDIDSLYLRSYSMAISYHKAFKPTMFLRNRAYIEFYKQGLIIGNNANVKYGRAAQIERERKKNKTNKELDDEKFPGALVADPLLNEALGEMIFGSNSMYIFNNAVDFDFSSMYPLIIIAFNIAANTMIGKLVMDTTPAEIRQRVEEDEEMELEDRGKEFVDNYLTKNYGMIGTKWFGLPSIQSLDEKFRARRKQKERDVARLPVPGMFAERIRIDA